MKNIRSFELFNESIENDLFNWVNNDNKILPIELAYLIRNNSNFDMTVDQFFDKFEVPNALRTDSNFSNILTNAEKYLKMTNAEFETVYKDYLSSNIDIESGSNACNLCKDTKYEKCPSCNFKKSIKCDLCDGVGYKDDGEECVLCSGLCKIDCKTCDGLGVINCTECI